MIERNTWTTIALAASLAGTLMFTGLATAGSDDYAREAPRAHKPDQPKTSPYKGGYSSMGPKDYHDHHRDERKCRDGDQQDRNGGRCRDYGN